MRKGRRRGGRVGEEGFIYEGKRLHMGDCEEQAVSTLMDDPLPKVKEEGQPAHIN